MFRNAGYWMAGVLALAAVAFWPRYLAVIPGDLSPYFHVHAIVMTLWFVLLIAQPFLVRASWRRVHRALGKASYVLAPAIAVAAVLLAHARLPPETDPSYDEAALYLYLPISMIALFELAWVLAIVFRKTQAIHARFMLATAVAIVDPIVSRLIDIYIEPTGAFARLRLEQLVSYGITAAILLVLIVRERKQYVGRAVFPLMLGAATVAYAGFYALAPSQPWHAFARWFGALPLT